MLLLVFAPEENKASHHSVALRKHGGVTSTESSSRRSCPLVRKLGSMKKSVYHQSVVSVPVRTAVSSSEDASKRPEIALNAASDQSSTNGPFLLPFPLAWSQENITIRDLNASWMACLGSLCGRMRDSSVSTEAEVGETRHQLRADQQPAPFDSDPQRHAAESPTSAGSNHHNQGTPSDQSEPDVNPNDHCPSPTAAGTASVEDVTVPFRSARTALGRGAGVLAQESNFSCRAQIEAPATVPIQDVRENAAEVARLSLDRTLVRVGARVPWGPRHRGRFAKVHLWRKRTECYRSA